MDTCRKCARVIDDSGSRILLLGTYRDKISIIPNHVIFHHLVSGVIPGVYPPREA